MNGNESEPDLSNLFDMGSLVQIHEPPTSPASGSIPFMITQAQRSRLRELGHRDQDDARRGASATERAILNIVGK